ncbi:low temperature requirement protein A [Cellulomonas sp.]|uniref:low temperature requirement protein A n=1 Tax=Cellulomonas sp. TaxID=40001 RepID=UPI002810B70C|nr:low temperature requirement protein A [Cellulomonas sp.]
MAADDGTRPLIRPPRLRTEDDRSASRLELFLDLAYVLVVAEVAGAFADDLTWHGAAVFAFLFTITWWSWVTGTLYANRFDTDDVVYRLAKLGTTFGVAVMAAAAADATGAETTAFTVGYLVTRVLLVALYVRAWRHVHDARATVGVYLAATAAGALVWASSLVASGTTVLVLWAVGILVEAVAPVVVTRLGDNAPLHVEHLPERFGLLVILVLGESVASVVTGMRDTAWDPASVAAALVGFVVAAALWWSYFDIGETVSRRHLADGDDPHRTGAGDRYVYGHLPLTLGLAAVGVGIEQYVVHPVGELTTGGRWALCGGVVLFLAGTAVVVAGEARSRSARVWPLLAVPVVVLLGVLDEVVPAATITVVALVLVVTILVGLGEQRRQVATPG